MAPSGPLLVLRPDYGSAIRCHSSTSCAGARRSDHDAPIFDSAPVVRPRTQSEGEIKMLMIEGQKAGESNEELESPPK